VKIPEEKIEQVREAADLLETVSQYVTLKKRGKSYVGLCPFHTEKTPSFNVDPVRGFYKCFGCGAGGNIFTFLMEMEKISFPEAVRQLAAKAGIDIPRYQEEDEERSREVELLYLVNKKAAEIYQGFLFETEEGKKALGYWIKRGFTEESARQYGIGYAPDSWDGLLKTAGEHSLQQEALFKAGLVLPRKDGGGFYDRFRCRLMFPVYNPSGRIVGFGGRVLKKGKGIPKYLNSPETLIYQKSRLLYGLFQSKNGIRARDQVIMVEGYTDVIRCHQEGLSCAVATSGTALTEEQARLLARYTKNVSLVYDGDSAGFTAALRGVDILYAAGLQVGIVALPRGSDPDTFGKTEGGAGLEALLKQSVSLIDFKMEKLRREGGLKTAAQRAAAARELMASVRRVRDPIEKNLMIKEIAEKLEVDEALLLRKGTAAASSQEERETGKIDKAGERAAKLLLALLVQDLARWGGVVFQLVRTEMLPGRAAVLIFNALKKQYQEKFYYKTDALMDQFAGDAAASAFMAEILSDPVDSGIEHTRLGLDCVIQLRRGELERRIEEAGKAIKRLEQAGKNISSERAAWVELRSELSRLPEETTAIWKEEIGD